jgi:hypothetical protein
MLGFLILVEFCGSLLLLSAIEWLRHLRGRTGVRSTEVRYLLPILTPVAFVLGVHGSPRKSPAHDHQQRWPPAGRERGIRSVGPVAGR